MSTACDQVNDDLAAIVDGDHDTIARHAEHLASCDTCRDARHESRRRSPSSSRRRLAITHRANPPASWIACSPRSTDRSPPAVASSPRASAVASVAEAARDHHCRDQAGSDCDHRPRAMPTTALPEFRASPSRHARRRSLPTSRRSAPRASGRGSLLEPPPPRSPRPAPASISPAATRMRMHRRLQSRRQLDRQARRR